MALSQQPQRREPKTQYKGIKYELPTNRGPKSICALNVSGKHFK